MFENFTEKYKNIVIHEEQFDATAGNELRKRELIFQATVAFEEFVQSYGYYHLSKSKHEINNTNSKLCEWKLYNCAYAVYLNPATKCSMENIDF